MGYTVVNNKIAGLNKNGLTYGGFKFVHLYAGTIEQVVWENIKGKSTMVKDSDGKVIKKEVPGFILYFQYKNCLNKWSGSLINTETGEQSTKGCLKIEIPLPKVLNTQSKLFKLFVLLGIVEKPNFLLETEEQLISDEDVVDDLNLDDLAEDIESDESSEGNEGDNQLLDIEGVSHDLLNHLNKVFLAPYTLNNNYPIISSDFESWEIPNKKK